MARVNKTVGNLKQVWQGLDDACGSLDNVFHTLAKMTDMPEDIKKSIGMIDFSAIVAIKNEVEKLIEEKGALLFEEQPK
jgi:hypothetical protein